MLKYKDAIECYSKLSKKIVATHFSFRFFTSNKPQPYTFALALLFELFDACMRDWLVAFHCEHVNKAREEGEEERDLNFAPK